MMQPAAPPISWRGRWEACARTTGCHSTPRCWPSNSRRRIPPPRCARPAGRWDSRSSHAPGRGEPCAAGPSPASRLSKPRLARHRPPRLLYLRAGEKEPRYMAVADFPRVFEKEILLVGAANAGAGASDPDGNMERPGFGFRWFIPQLLKYKSIWRDVLLASVAIQLVGLTTPLFTQV